ncbi:hypothetical protein F2Q70_00015406 [Brassica cretica]|uniref:Uncharacterized protein n=1 Tax=Brassica cretica TaxID=69181 RepID=A0A8S9HZ30_BRACR|nr:hypothetical protein F2Q70_00015406 [Brassica cretica]
METSINVGNNRLPAPGGINRQTAPLDCSSGKVSNSCSFLHDDGVTEKEMMHGMIGADGDSARSPLFFADCSGAVVPTA